MLNILVLFLYNSRITIHKVSKQTVLEESAGLQNEIY